MFRKNDGDANTRNKPPKRQIFRVELLTLADSPSVPPVEVSDPPSLGGIPSDRLAAIEATVARPESQLSRPTVADFAAE